MTETLLTLAKENYHSLEANRQYMSHSQYQDFLSCEAMAMAKLNGWIEQPTSAMDVGSYVDAYFEGEEEFERFKEQHPDCFSSRGPTKGELKAQYRLAEKMIATLKNDPLCMFVMQGEKQAILTAEFAGAMWKIKMDFYNPEKQRIVDLKTAASLTKQIWDPKYGYVTFVEANRYLTQMAVYAEIERRHVKRDGWLETLIVAVSKEDPPDKAVIGLNAYDIERELEEVQRNMPRILNVRAGIEKPVRCEKCRYCRETKKLDRIIHYSDLLVS